MELNQYNRKTVALPLCQHATNKTKTIYEKNIKLKSNFLKLKESPSENAGAYSLFPFYY